MSASPDEILSMICFARVVEAGSFTAAADKLGLSKSVVSARVAQLEDRVGSRLLNRTTRKLSLTADGMAFYERCARLVSAADDATADVDGPSEVPRGALRVLAPAAFAQEYLAPPLATYVERHPQVRVELTLSDKLVDLADDGIDLAIRIAPSVEGGGSLSSRRLAGDHTVLCASPGYLARKGLPTAAEQLVQHDCLVYSLLRISDEWRFRAPGGRDTFTVPIEGRFQAASAGVLRQAALAGMGITVLPSFMVAEDLALGRLRTVVDTFAGVELGIFAVYAQARRPPTKVRALVDVLAAHFKKPRWGATTLPGIMPGATTAIGFTGR
jgi:DNA-binding transcriptional LysR family regulator